MNPTRMESSPSSDFAASYVLEFSFLLFHASCFTHFSQTSRHFVLTLHLSISSGGHVGFRFRAMQAGLLWAVLPCALADMPTSASQCARSRCRWVIGHGLCTRSLAWGGHMPSGAGILMIVHPESARGYGPTIALPLVSLTAFISYVHTSPLTFQSGVHVLARFYFAFPWLLMRGYMSCVC